MGQSRNENLLEDILGASNTFGKPQSRIEAILQNMLGAENEIGEPLSRNEQLLTQILEQGVGNWDWKGKNAECISPILFTSTKTLDQTDFATWTPVTGERPTVLASQTLSPVEIDKYSYDYLIQGQVDIQLKYSTLSGVELEQRRIAEYWFPICWTAEFSSSQTGKLFSPAFSVMPAISKQCLIINKKANGTYNGAYSTSSVEGSWFGIYPSLTQTPAMGSKLTIYTPAFLVQCGSSGTFTPAIAADIDQQFSTIKQKISLWRMDQGTAMTQTSESLAQLLNNPL